ncbi:Serine/threonine-protein kinase STY8 [Mycena venus]|uniref:Serine/threonine-protein kinase STY8 n=1 Tax=Mycena venus TaxID=2733690 RepID=A0A8H6YHD5_9AGAR|nr:Serine/threonine-protein kinase STY8 [Mycena venus]
MLGAYLSDYSLAVLLDNMRYELSPAIFSPVYGPACFLATVLVFLGGSPLFTNAVTEEDKGSLLLLFVPLYATFLLRVLQFILTILGNYYFKQTYFRMRAGLSFFAVLNTVLWLVFWKDVSDITMLHVCIFYTDALCVTELLFRDKFRQYALDNLVLGCAEFFLSCDSLSRDPEIGFDLMKRRNSRLKRLRGRIVQMLKFPRKGTIALPDNEESLGLAALAASYSPFVVSPELSTIVGDWAQISIQKPRALWISTDATVYDVISDEIAAILRSPGLGAAKSVAVKVDVSEARAILWPLVDGLVRASSEYREELGINPPWQFRFYYPLFSHYTPTFASYEPYRAPWPDSDEASDLLHELICIPLLQRHQRLQRPLARATLIVQGITSEEQVEELYHAIRTLDAYLEDLFAVLNIIVIGPPSFLRFISDSYAHMMGHVCTLYISESGSSMIYSGNLPPAPRLAENLFMFLVNSIQWTGGEAADRLWDATRGVARLSRKNVFVELDVDYTNITDPSSEVTEFEVLATLHGAYNDRQRILEAVRELPRMPMMYIVNNLAKDNVKIAQYVQWLFNVDVATIVPEHGLALLNLLHDVLDLRDVDRPKNDMIPLPEVSFQRAFRLLNALAVHLGQLPDGMNLTNVVLLSDHPLKQGGFSEIYHGNWISRGSGEGVQVALKVLKRFQNREDGRKTVHEELFREALAWRYLWHENIAVFYGVDYLTFSSPAMVSLWFAQGNVVKYMAQHSPTSSYAIEMVCVPFSRAIPYLIWQIPKLCGIIAGLQYLHSKEIVHGDLCARNILIADDGRPCLTDFGLTGLIDPEASSGGATKPVGSTRWMAPELFAPPFQPTMASDIWAFACVCCEIWTEGQRLFNHIDSETGVITALVQPDCTPAEGMEWIDAGAGPAAGPSGSISDWKQPYLKQPLDQNENLMPIALWELVRWCWSTNRPTAADVGGDLAQIRAALRPEPEELFE